MYEITYITKNENAGSVKDELKELKAKILSEESLGRKKLAYKIKKENSGFYQTVIFEMESKNLEELNKKLSLDTEIIRFLIVKRENMPAIEERPETVKEKVVKPREKEVLPMAKEVHKEKPAPAKVQTPPAAKKEKTEKIKTAKKTVKAKPTTPKIKLATKITAEKEISDEERLKQLDDKLSELLKD